MKSIYVAGSLANPEIMPLANRLRAGGLMPSMNGFAEVLNGPLLGSVRKGQR